MFPANTYVIRYATPHDEPALRRLAYLDGHLPPEGRVLIGEIGGVAAVAIGLDNERVISDPLQPAGHLRAQLRMRAAAITAAERTPSLPARMLAGLEPPRVPARRA